MILRFANTSGPNPPTNADDWQTCDEIDTIIAKDREQRQIREAVASVILKAKDDTP